MSRPDFAMADARELKSTLAILVLDEIEAIQQVLPKIDRSWVDEIIVVDGGSTDGTIEYCESQGLQVLRQRQHGYGRGMMELIDRAKGDIIIEFMGDGNCKAETIPLLIKKIKEGYDLVIGSRYAGGARSFDDTMMTRFGNWGFTQLINVLFRAHFADAMMGYRAYRKDAFFSSRWIARGSVSDARVDPVRALRVPNGGDPLRRATPPGRRAEGQEPPDGDGAVRDDRARVLSRVRPAQQPGTPAQPVLTVSAAPRSMTWMSPSVKRSFRVAASASSAAKLSSSNRP